MLLREMEKRPLSPSQEEEEEEEEKGFASICVHGDIAESLFPLQMHIASSS